MRLDARGRRLRYAAPVAVFMGLIVMFLSGGGDLGGTASDSTDAAPSDGSDRAGP